MLAAGKESRDESACWRSAQQLGEDHTKADREQVDSAAKNPSCIVIKLRIRKIPSPSLPHQLSLRTLLQKLLRHLDLLIPDIVGKALAQRVEPGTSTDTSAQNAIHHKVHRPHIGELHSLDVVALLPVLADELDHLLAGQERTEPVPLRLFADEESDVDVGALVAGTGEHDVAESDGLGGAGGAQVNGVGGVVVGAGLQDFVFGWVAGVDAFDVAGLGIEEVDRAV